MISRPCLLAAVAILGLFGTGMSRAEGPPRRPNIILILADDLGYSDLGCYGGEIRTPHLDALAAGGLRFTQFYNGARCCPTRAALLTGLYAHQAGVGNMDADQGLPGYRGHLLDSTVTLPEMLREAGYRTLMAGKWHLGRPGPVARGFDEYYGMLGGFGSFWDPRGFIRLPPDRPARTYPEGRFYATEAITDHALDFLASARRAEDRPYFLYLAYTAPHFPLHAPKEDIDRYVATYRQGWDVVRERRHARMKELGLVRPDWPLSPLSEYRGRDGTMKAGVNPAWDALAPDRREDMARRMAIYAAMVEVMDRAIGRLVADLRASGELDRTLILFLSDNGACAEWSPWGFDVRSGPDNTLHTGADLDRMGGPGTYHSYGSGWANASNTPWRLYKHYVHEGGISTPLIVHWPERVRDRGALRQQVGHIIDILPTLREVASAPNPKQLGDQRTPTEGTSLIPAFDDRPTTRDALYWEHEGNRAVRAGRWKLVARRGQPWELYDLEADRVERHDLADREPERARELAARWEAWARRALVVPSPVLERRDNDRKP